MDCYRLLTEDHRETGEHIQTSANELQYIPFPTCLETSQPLTLHYGKEGPQNCTFNVDDSLYHLLEFYIHNDAPLTCRLPARPPSTVKYHPDSPEAAAELDEELKPEYVPLIFALAGQLQLSHLHVSSKMNILLHSVPKHHLQKHDSGIIDSGAAYSTSPLASVSPNPEATYHNLPDLVHNQKLVIGETLKLQFDVRWFPSPNLPQTNGKYEWNGMRGYAQMSKVFYVLLGASVGILVTLYWTRKQALKAEAKRLGGATPLGGYGLSNGRKRLD